MVQWIVSAPMINLQDSDHRSNGQLIPTFASNCQVLHRHSMTTAWSLAIWMSFTSPRAPRIRLHKTQATSGCHPERVPPEMMLISGLWTEPDGDGTRRWEKKDITISLNRKFKKDNTLKSTQLTLTSVKDEY